MTLAQEINRAYTGTINIYTSPLPGVQPIQIQVPAGVQIMQHVPEAKLPWVCVANGLPLKRDYWQTRMVTAGDVIDLHPVVMGKTSRGIVAAIAIIVIAYFAPPLAAAMGATGAAATAVAAGITMIGSALVNALIAPKPDNSANQGTTASSTYDVAMSGNQARLNSPIPVCYGRMRSFPDYASQPYVEYDTTTNPDGDQFFYGLYAIGHGDFDIGAVTIGDSDINAFTNVEYKILKPGEHPTLVEPNVVSAIEVNGQVLNDKIFVGPFVSCGPGRKIKALGIDVVFPRGLAKLGGDGKPSDASVEIEISYREINDGYMPLTDWITIPSQKVTAKTVTSQRRSFYFEMNEPKRIAVRLRRLNAPSEGTDLFDEVGWYSMRGYLSNSAPLAPTVTHMEVRIKASEQMSGASQRKIGVIWQRKVKTWSPEAGLTDEPVVTRNPMWALLDKWTNPVYGDRIPLDRIDLPALHYVAMVCDERKDRFDYIFDTRITSFEADRIIGTSCRSAPIRRNGKRSIIRDEWEDLPVTAFTTRNITSDSSSYQYMQVTDESADGIVVEYFDRNAFDWLEIECPAPGRNYTSPLDPRWKGDEVPPMENPIKLQLPGITGPTQAEREGLYQAASNSLRRKYCNWSTELGATLVWFGAPILFAPVLHNAAQSGDCAFWNEETRNLSLSEQPQLTDYSSIVLMRQDGSLTMPIPVTPGEDEYSVVLSELPGFELQLSDNKTERTKYVLMQGIENREIVKMLAIRPRGKDSEGAAQFEMYGVIDNEEVHKVDNHLLSGSIDDPDAFEKWPGEDNETPPGGTVNLPGTIEIESVSFVKPKLILQSDGVARVERADRRFGNVVELLKNQWAVTSPEPVEGIGAAYQVQVRHAAQFSGDGEYYSPWFTDIPKTYANGFNESPWMPLTSDITLELIGDPFRGTLQIRDANEPNTIQSTSSLYMKTTGYNGSDQ